MYAELVDAPSARQSSKPDDIADSQKSGDNGIGVATPDWLVLTTQCYDSGRAEISQLPYFRAGDSYVIAATTNHQGTKPSWFLSLKKQPLVQLEIGGIQLYAQAKTPTGRERLSLLPVARQLVPDILNKVPRDTSIVVMCPTW